MFDLYGCIKEAVEKIPIEVTDLQIMDVVITALKNCEAARKQHGYQ